MKKLIFEILVSLPGAGKTTYAINKCQQDPSWIRLSKDDIRVSLRKNNNLAEDARVNEKQVLKIQDEFFVSAFKQGKNVISEDTNLNVIHINERLPKLLKDNGLDDIVEIVVNKEFLKVPIEECIRRDTLRTGIARVGAKVIKGMWNRYKYHWEEKSYNKYLVRLQNYDGSKYPAVIFDIDGTISLITDRSPFNEEKCESDLPNIPVVNLLKMMITYNQICDLNSREQVSLMKEVIFVSGRQDKAREQTLNWISKYIGIKRENIILFMRKTGDSRKDSIVKEEIYKTHIEPFYMVEWVCDDRARVIRETWKALGLFTFRVGLIDEDEF